MTTTIAIARSGFARKENVKAYMYDRLAVHRSLSNTQRWIVTHPESGMSVTGGRQFDSRAQAKRFADELQKRLDFDLLKPNARDQWDVRAAFGQDNIKRAMSAAFQEAYGS